MKKILCILWIALFLLGCSRSVEDTQAILKKADFYASQGREYTTKSIELYKLLIRREDQTGLKDSLKIKLGDLYLGIG
ncbi:hypothetical protein HQ550_01305, partial [bacterium]|nr:hypothetical protein [bacterium]